ncbi:MAG: hypothetical protein J6S52_03155 [Prevotella sp.]|nr:hypothetical protein [Prevotella sp.]
MRRRIITAALIMAVGYQYCEAQNSGGTIHQRMASISSSSGSSYDEFVNYTNKNYENFRDSINKVFADFMEKGGWPKTPIKEGEVKPKKDEKPPVIFDEAKEQKLRELLRKKIEEQRKKENKLNIQKDEQLKKEEQLRLQQEELRLQQDEQRNKEEKLRLQQQEQRNKEDQLRLKEEEQRNREEQLRLKEEEQRNKEEQLNLKQGNNKRSNKELLQQQEVLRKQEEKLRLQQEGLRKQEEKLRQQQEEQKKKEEQLRLQKKEQQMKEEQLKKQQGDQLKKEERLKLQQEEQKNKEEQLRLQQDEQRNKENLLRLQQEEQRNKEEQLRLQQEEQRNKEEQLRLKQGNQKKSNEELLLQQQQLKKQEEQLKKQQEGLRKQEEQLRQQQQEQKAKEDRLNQQQQEQKKKEEQLIKQQKEHQAKLQEEKRKKEEEALPVNVIPVIEIPVDNTPKKQPVPVAPIRENDEVNSYAEFDVFGTDMKVRWGDLPDFKLSGKNEKAVADAFRTLTSSKYNNLIRDCLANRIKYDLCDWAYYKMLQSMTEKALGKGTSEARIAQGILLNQTGYNIRFGFDPDNSDIYFLVKTASSPYGMPIAIVDGDYYYSLEKVKSRWLNVFNSAYPGEQTFTFDLNKVPAFATTPSDDRVITSARYSVEATSSVNKNLIDFFNTYPSSYVMKEVMTNWGFYANTPMSKEVKDKLYPTLKKNIAGMDQKTAANVLLNWVQTGFKYEYDNVVWGEERSFFAEESLFYPFCDCEDRSILYSHLVRDLMGLDVVLVYYPGHMATAVNFTEEVRGDYLELNGRKFVIADGTYIGAPVGRTMPGMDNQKAKVMLLKRDL